MKKSNGSAFVAGIVILATLILGCQYFQLPEHLQSEAALENRKTAIDDSSVFLNAEDCGRISDIGRQQKPLSPDFGTTSVDRKIAEIVRDREGNGVFLEGTNITPSNVYLMANPQLSVGAFAKLFRAIDESARVVYIPRASTPEQPPVPRKPDPYTLIVRTELQSGRMEFPPDWPMHDPEFRYSYDIELEIAKSAEQLKGIRMWEDSIEVSADERFFINEKQGPEADYGSKYSRVKQRPIEEVQVRDELAKLPVSADRKLIIVSEKAAYGTLLRILEHLKEPNTKFRIVVRPNGFDARAGESDR